MAVSTLEGIIRATLLLEGVPHSVEEADIIGALESYGRDRGTYINVHELRPVEKQMLVTIETTENGKSYECVFASLNIRFILR